MPVCRMSHRLSDGFRNFLLKPQAQICHSEALRARFHGYRRGLTGVSMLTCLRAGKAEKHFPSLEEKPDAA